MRARYLPQVAAYWRATSEMTRFEVDAALFSTALGRFLPYEPTELTAAWDRLTKTAPEDFLATVALPPFE